MRKYSLHWSLHPLKTKDWYEAEKLRRTEDEVARELDINYSLSVSGKVFAPFKEERHVSSEAIQFNPHSPVYRIWDFGKTNATLYAQIDSYDRKRILHERVLGHKDGGEFSDASNFDEQLRVALADSRELFPEAQFIDICDPAGTYEDERGSRPEVEGLWEEERIAAQFDRIVGLPTKERKVRGRSLIMKDLQATPGGKEAFLMHVAGNGSAGCPILKKAFQGGYCYKKDSNGNILDAIREVHPYEDVIDCLIYLYLQTDGHNDNEHDSIDPWDNTPYRNPITGL